MATDWSIKLERPIRIRDGLTLRKLSDARAFMLSMPQRRRRRPAWRKAAKLLADAAERGYVKSVTDQIEHALWADFRMDIDRKSIDSTPSE
jgi:hypothetical protein